VANGVNIIQAVNATIDYNIVPLAPDNSSPNGHGTAMAHVFYEIAPEAEIYLIDRYDGATSANIIAWLQANNIQIVSNSLNGTNYDHQNGIFSGTENIAAPLDACVNAGILVCTIAGNYQQNSHFAHLQRDLATGNMIFPDGNPYIDFTMNNNVFVLDICRQNNNGSTYSINALNLRTGDDAINVTSPYYIHYKKLIFQIEFNLTT
jgi:hypothetical protein